MRKLLLAVLMGLIAVPAVAVDYRIVETQPLPRGGSLHPLKPPQFTLEMVWAVAENPKNLTEYKVRQILDTIIAEVRRQDNPDGVSVYLYETAKHVKNATALGVADWVPKGENFDPENAVNVRNRGTHVTTYQIDLPQERAEEKIVSRLSETQRREIFTELLKAEDRAEQDSEAKYPTNRNTIPMDKWKSYDWHTAVRKKAKLWRKLQDKYEKQVRREYGITEEEEDQIDLEAFEENWPMPITAK